MGLETAVGHRTDHHSQQRASPCGRRDQNRSLVVAAVGGLLASWVRHSHVVVAHIRLGLEAARSPLGHLVGHIPLVLGRDHTHHLLEGHNHRGRGNHLGGSHHALEIVEFR